MKILISSANQEVNISSLRSGVYILTAKKEDGEIIRHKFLKM